MTLETFVAQNPGIENSRDVTAEYCSQEIECVEAWETEYGVYARFKTEKEAVHWGKIFGGDGAQWENFTLDTRYVELSHEERMSAVQILLSYDGV